MKFAKYGEWSKFAASIRHPKAIRFSASGAFLHGPGAPGPTKGSAPQPHDRLTLCTCHVCPPHIFDFATHLLDWNKACNFWILIIINFNNNNFNSLVIHLTIHFNNNFGLTIHV